MNTMDYEVLVFYLSISIFVLLYTLLLLFILLLLLGKCSFSKQASYVERKKTEDFFITDDKKIENC